MLFSPLDNVVGVRACERVSKEHPNVVLHRDQFRRQLILPTSNVTLSDLKEDQEGL